MNLERIVNVADARRAARRTLPRVVFDYVDGAADDETTMRENERAFEDVVFRPRMGAGRFSPDLSTTVLGTEVSVPVLLAPCGLVRAMHPAAGVGVARAASSRGSISVLSTVAGSSVEDVAAAAPGRVWFQLYASGGRPDAERICEKARAAGISVLVVTMDTPALGNRERDIRHGVSPPLRIGPQNAFHLGPQVLARPAWTYRMARDGLSLLHLPSLPSRESLRGLARTRASDVREGGRGVSAAPKLLSMAASPFSWDDIAWLRGLWEGSLVVKGLLTGEDARCAAGCGADGIIVSNHGGRQLNGAPATISVVTEIVDAVGSPGSAGRPEVYLDGGVRRGTDVVKALALGARAVFVGRPYLWGLAAGGEAGVGRMLDIFSTDLGRTLLLLGCESVSDLGRDWVAPRIASRADASRYAAS